MRIRVKVCGITRTEDARAAADLGADAVGFNFVPGSPRAVSPEAAADLAAALPPFVVRVGVFADAPADVMVETARRAALDLLQLHGHESPEACRALPLPWFKAHRVDAAFRPGDPARWGGSIFLLDGARPGVLGGGGAPFDWRLARDAAAHGRVIVAGGLTPENVGEAIRQARPWAVDVAGGVESSPGRKDAALLARFLRRVAEAGLAIEETA